LTGLSFNCFSSSLISLIKGFDSYFYYFNDFLLDLLDFDDDDYLGSAEARFNFGTRGDFISTFYFTSSDFFSSSESL